MVWKSLDTIHPSIKFDLNHLELMDKRADSLNIPKRILFRLVYKESAYNPYALSPKLAFGYCQLIPETYAYYKKVFRYDGYHSPEINIIIGTQKLHDLYKYWKPICKSEKKTWVYILASYNAGKGNVIKYGGIPPFKETIDFVNYILK